MTRRSGCAPWLGVGLALTFCTPPGPAIACELAGMAAALADADEHQFWIEFWEESDPEESVREIGYAAWALQKTLRLADSADCDNRRRAVALRDSAFRTLQRLEQRGAPMQVSLGVQP